MQQRDSVRKEYFPYSIPKKWHCPLYTPRMEEKVNCTNCGKETTFGKCYTSKTIHTENGFGYPVCEVCYSLEKK